MTDREQTSISITKKVIKGFTCCDGAAVHLGHCQEDCPYFDENERADKCVEKLHSDVLSLLKAQEPRVMTLEEVMVYDNRNGCIWYEDETKNIVPAFVFSEGYRRTSGIIGVMSPCFTFIAKPQYHRFERMEGYGKTWRCWTSRPTEEQREAVKW